MIPQKGDRFFAEARTAVVFRNGVRTIKKMFESGDRVKDEADCSQWVAEQNAALNPPVEKKVVKKAPKKK